MQAQTTNINYRRHIRSFANRARRLTSKQQQTVAELQKQYILNISNHQVDYTTIFATPSPVTLEIGFGMGDWLWQMIKSFPHRNFIGIEVHTPGVAKLLEKLKDDPCNNIRIYQDDAINVLTQCIPDNSLEQLCLFFPDPWPKQRHHKRRILQPAFASLIQQKLAPQGVFHMATDCENYAKHSFTVLSNTQGLQVSTAGQSPLATRIILTKFEQRALLQGSTISELVFVKVTI